MSDVKRYAEASHARYDGECIVANVEKPDGVYVRYDDYKALLDRLQGGLERIERLRGWIEDRIDECPYGEMDFEACGHNRKHGICESHAAAKVLAQDTFVSDPAVERHDAKKEGGQS